MAAGSGAPRPPSGAVLILVVLALVVIGANSMGALTAQPLFRIDESGGFNLLPDSAPSSAAEPTAQPTHGTASPTATGPTTRTLLAIVVLLGIIALVLLVRYLVRFRLGQRTEFARSEPGGIADRLEARELARFRDSLDAAEAALHGDEEHSTAVIRCWLALERAAAEAGQSRRGSQTPTEFTVRLLSIFDAAPKDIDVLLRVYHRARFATGPEKDLSGPEMEAAGHAFNLIRAAIDRRLPGRAPGRARHPTAPDIDDMSPP